MEDENKHKQNHPDYSKWPFCCHLTNVNSAAQGISLRAAISSFKTQKPLWHFRGLGFENWFSHFICPNAWWWKIW